MWAGLLNAALLCVTLAPVALVSEEAGTAARLLGEAAGRAWQHLYGWTCGCRVSLTS